MLDQLRTCYWRRNESSLLCERDQEKNAIISLMNVPQGTMCLSFGPPRWHHWFIVGSSGGELVDIGLWVSGGVTTPGWTVCLTVWKPKSRGSLVSDCNLIFFYHFVFFYSVLLYPRLTLHLTPDWRQPRACVSPASAFQASTTASSTSFVFLSYPFLR